MTTQNIFLEFSKSKSTNVITIPFNDDVIFNIKSSGLYNNNYFIANYKFSIDVENLIIKDIFFISITKENNENSLDCVDDDKTENNFEHNIHCLIKYFLEQSVINIHNNDFIISFNLETIDYYLMNINFTKNIEIINKNSSNEFLCSDKNIKTERSILRQVMWASLLSFTLDIFNNK